MLMCTGSLLGALSRRGLGLGSFAGSKVLLDAGVGVTLGLTPRATGTTPPVVTFTTMPALGVRVEIQTTGARGAATFRWSPDNGTTWVQSGQVTAATFPLSGLAAGGILNFPVGTYTNDNVYQATVSNWADGSGTGNHLAQPTAALQPFMVTASALLNGKPALRWDGTSLTIFRNPLVGVIVQPNTMVAAFNLTDQSTNRTLVDGNGTDRQQLQTSTNVYSITAGTVLNSTAVLPATGAHTYFGSFNGASSNILIDNAHSATGAAGAGNLGACYIGANFLAGVNFQGDVGSVAIYNRLLAAGELAAIQGLLRAKYATT